MKTEDIIQKIHGLILNHLPIRTKKSPKGWITFDCVMCTDTRGRAGVKVSGAKISYHCFNCAGSSTTGWQPGLPLGHKYKNLAQRLGCEEHDVHESQLLLLKYSDELGANAPEIDFVPGQTHFPKRQLPKAAQLIEDLPSDDPLRVYAEERGVLGQFPLLSIPEKPWENRLVVPFMYNEELVGLTGRLRGPTSASEPKYYTECPSNFVFNVDAFSASERSIVVVTEGVLDAIALDCVSILGNEISAEQAHIIEKLGDRIIVCPDKDKSGKELIRQAIALGWEVSFPPWEKCKDATEAVQKYGRLLTLASVIEYASDNPIKSEVMMRMSM